MPQGYSANVEIALSLKQLGKVVPEELAGLEIYRTSTGLSWEQVYEIMTYGEIWGNSPISEKEVKILEDIYNKLAESFENKTGLQIIIEFHDSDTVGGYYDNVDGVFFSLCGTHEETPAFKKLKEQGIDPIEARYITYG